jgi:hypothetical protein
MDPHASRWFHQAKTNLASLSADLSQTESVSDLSYKDFHMAHALAINGVIAAKGGSIPGQHKLVSICQSIGLWPVMPPKLQEHLIAIDCFVDPVETGGQASAASLTVDELKERLQIAPKFLFFMENHVASNPLILGGLTVS